MRNEHNKREAMNYDRVKNLYDTIDLASETIQGWATDQPMRRYERQLLFNAEDALDKAIHELSDLMQRAYKGEPRFREWGLAEGWIEPKTPEEEAYVESLD